MQRTRNGVSVIVRQNVRLYVVLYQPLVHVIHCALANKFAKY